MTTSRSGVAMLAAWLAALMLLVAQTACRQTEGNEVNLPADTRDFIYKYFPLDYVSSKEELPDSSGYKVRIADGPTLWFDSEGKWTQLNGNGGTLPPMFAFDCFPTPLYDYVESLEQVDAIYSASRNSETYTVLLLSTRITYSISTGKITETEP